ncbi:aspartate dehydrogenase [Rhizobiales bacterium L72]|uniref:L-aspartate dehydrogenase n=2 Tax=Propylenella binzhouense TaxID=2555902 RepID=A0A964T4Y7_9HYPH|nr:aspartate dehydrogenase [Propylenella binzhouense]
MPAAGKRVATIGFGAMARSLRASLAADEAMPAIGAALVPPGKVAAAPAGPDDVAFFPEVDALLAWRPELVVECASHQAVATVLPTVLRRGVDCVIVSIGALGDAAVRAEIEESARAGGARAVIASGAIGGLDVLRAAAAAGLDHVVYTGRKPPHAWLGSPAGERFDLAALRSETIIFEGDARAAAALYPKNANVTAAVALAGIGFERTRVTLVADPAIGRNIHELEAAGAFGSFRIRLENAPLPDNPKTSWLAALSIVQAIRSHFSSIR